MFLFIWPCLSLPAVPGASAREGEWAGDGAAGDRPAPSPSWSKAILHSNQGPKLRYSPGYTARLPMPPCPELSLACAGDLQGRKQLWVQGLDAALQPRVCDKAGLGLQPAERGLPGVGRRRRLTSLGLVGGPLRRVGHLSETLRGRTQGQTPLGHRVPLRASLRQAGRTGWGPVTSSFWTTPFR